MQSSYRTRSCKSNGCTLEDNEHMLTCGKCKQPTHFICTRLPAYQLYQFVKKGEKRVMGKKQRKYVCEACVGVVPRDFYLNSIEGNARPRAQDPASSKYQHPDALTKLQKEHDELKRKYEALLDQKQTTVTKCSKCSPPDVSSSGRASISSYSQYGKKPSPTPSYKHEETTKANTVSTSEGYDKQIQSDKTSKRASSVKLRRRSSMAKRNNDGVRRKLSVEYAGYRPTSSCRNSVDESYLDQKLKQDLRSRQKRYSVDESVLREEKKVTKEKRHSSTVGVTFSGSKDQLYKSSATSSCKYEEPTIDNTCSTAEGLDKQIPSDEARKKVVRRKSSLSTRKPGEVRRKFSVEFSDHNLEKPFKNKASPAELNKKLESTLASRRIRRHSTSSVVQSKISKSERKAKTVSLNMDNVTSDTEDLSMYRKPANIIRCYSQSSFVPPSHLHGEDENILALQLKTGQLRATLANLQGRL